MYNEQEKPLTQADLKGRNIAILGFGIEGESLVEFLMGKADRITVLDERNRGDFDEDVLTTNEDGGITFRFGRITHLEGYDIVFRSPGFYPASDLLLETKKKGIRVSSATKLFFDLCPCEIIGITGTKGKGTTSTLIYEMLKEAGEDVYLGGNIGTPPLNFLDELDTDSKVVLELSSFQLMDMERSPHIAVMLMTTSEHLDYHKDVYEYIDAKRNIFRYQIASDFAIVNQDYPASNEFDIEGDARTFKVSREREVLEQGCFVRDGKMVLKMHGREEEMFDMKELGLRGKHNWENACAAVMAAVAAEASMNAIVSVLKSFKGLPHRLEHIATVKGVKYYNDTFSTTPETAIAAIESFDEPKILLLGGSSKGSDFTELGDVISNSSSIKAIIAIGEEWTNIRAKIKEQKSKIEIIEGLESMEQFVQKAAEIAEIGDVVLLSPACASFDKFKNYKERGEAFREQVDNLTS